MKILWFGVCLLLAACASQPPGQTLVDPSSGLSLSWPETFVLERQSPVAYLLTTSWRVDLRPNEPGRLVAGWVLAGSDEVTAARLRYGVSSDARSLDLCLKPGGGGLATDQVMIGGRPFTHFHLQDAGMSHYLEADAYRSRYQNRCYAIDLIINGTNPQVYEPPRIPPFSREQAQAALHDLLLRVEWLAPETTP